MRDPGPARSGPALLCSTRWLNTQPPNYREQSRAAGHLSLHPKPPSSLPLHSFLSLFEQKIQSRNRFMAETASLKRASPGWSRLHRHCYLCRSKCSLSFFSSSLHSLLLPSWCTPVFVFCHEEASAASLSARLFLKDMRSYPAQPFPFPANPNKAGMPRERRVGLRVLCF